MVISTERSRRGLSASRRRARLPGAFIWFNACNRISASMNVKIDCREKRARAAGAVRPRWPITPPLSVTSAMNGPLIGGSV